MCFGAAYWARVDAVVYAATAADAAAAGFDDASIYSEVPMKDDERSVPFLSLGNELSPAERVRPFTAWAAHAAKASY